MKRLFINQRHGTAISSAPVSATAASIAADRQKLFRRSIGLLPVLARRGVAPCDALAVAFNAVFLFYNMPHGMLWDMNRLYTQGSGDDLPRIRFMFSPKTILRKYSYAEMASLCEHLLGMTEFAVNKSFKEELP